MKRATFALTLFFFVTGCAASFGNTSATPPAATPTALFLVTSPPDSTPESGPPRIYPTLQIIPATTRTPGPVDLIPQPQKQISILLLGSDQRPGATNYHTDVIILMTIKANGTVSLVSFPRSLYVYIPGFRMDSINNVFLLGGFDLLATTFEYNFGIRPEHYLLTNFGSFKSIVDSLGGVDVNVGKTFHDTRTGYPDGYTVYPGIVHMNGEMALWYIRARMTTSDLDRLRRAQEVLVAIGQKFFSRDAFEHIPDLYKSYRQAAVTDLTLGDMFRLLPLVRASDPNRVERYTFTSDHLQPWIEPTSQNFYLLPKQEAIRQLLMQAVGNP